MCSEKVQLVSSWIFTYRQPQFHLRTKWSVEHAVLYFMIHKSFSCVLPNCLCVDALHLRIEILVSRERERERGGEGGREGGRERETERERERERERGCDSVYMFDVYFVSFLYMYINHFPHSHHVLCKVLRAFFFFFRKKEFVL